MNVEDEILIDDSNDESDFVFGKSRRRSLRSHGKNTHNSSSGKLVDIDDEFDYESPQRMIKGNSRSGKKISSTFESKIKNILNKSGTKLTRSDSAPSQSTPKVTQIKSKKLGEEWKNVKSKLTPGSSQMGSKFKSKLKGTEVNYSDSDYDFESTLHRSKGEKKLEASSQRMTRNSSRTSMNASNSSVIELDDEEEDELEKEFAKIDQLKLDFERQSSLTEKKSSIKTFPVKKVSSAPTLKSVNKSNNNVINKKSISKLKAPQTVKIPKVIETEPIDCLDDLIVLTDLGYPCNYCDKNLVFKKRRQMVNHLQAEHEEELSLEQRNKELAGIFVCDICDTIFCSKFILRTHKKAHAKLKMNENCDNYFKYYLNFSSRT